MRGDFDLAATSFAVLLCFELRPVVFNGPATEKKVDSANGCGIVFGWGSKAVDGRFFSLVFLTDLCPAALCAEAGKFVEFILSTS